MPDVWPHAKEKYVETAPRLSDRAYEKQDGAAEELSKVSDYFLIIKGPAHQDRMEVYIDEQSDASRPPAQS